MPRVFLTSICVLAFALLILSSENAIAQTRPVLSNAIENKDWPPHYQWIDGQPVGPDPDIATEILDQLGYGVRFRPVPWKRAINLVLSARVDALLDLTTTPERRKQLYFPRNPSDA